MSVDLVIGGALSAAALGQCVLATSLLALRDRARAHAAPLMVFFLANGLTEIPAVLALFPRQGGMPLAVQLMELLAICGFLSLAPVLWIYMRNLTDEQAPRWQRSDAVHLPVFLAGLTLCAGLLIAPDSVRQEVLADGPEQPGRLAAGLNLALAVVMVAWSVQSLVYLTLIRRRLMGYRARLKDLFASTEDREMRWISWVILLLCANLAIVIGEMFSSTLDQLDVLGSALDLGLVWILSLWGMRQIPLYLEQPPAIEPTRSPSASKYENSALGAQQMIRISQKIESAMSESQAYLEPGLSLRMLAEQITVPPNYVSQTLNTQLQSSFFDYVNQWRIRAAKPLLCNSEDPVLDIAYAVGFNSRSSFYKAFRGETGMTPSQYRRQTSAV